MALKFSTGLVDAVALDKSFKEAVEGASAAGFYIDIYTGTRPATCVRNSRSVGIKSVLPLNAILVN